MSDRHNSMAEHNMKLSRWVQKLLLSYWIIIAVHGIAQLFCFLFLPYPATALQFYVHILILPTIIMSGVTLLAQFVHRKYNVFGFYSLFFAGTIIAVMIIRLNYDIRIITAAFLLPIFTSVIFFRRGLTFFSGALQLGGFGVLYVIDAKFRGYLSVFDLVAIPLFLVAGTLIANIIRMSGQELLRDLQATLTAKQDLIVENALMVKLSKTDALTNLYNHISFHEYYNKAVEYAAAVPFHLALIDIDNFKSINDSFGHRTGDIILARVGQLIKENMATNDVAARYGGEEFALLLFEKSPEEALQTLEKIRIQLSQLHHRELNGKAVTVSIGLKGYAAPLTKEQLFEGTDAYLYAAKNGGKNRTVISS